MPKFILLLLLLCSCQPSVEWVPTDTIYLSTIRAQKVLAECRMLANTGGGAHSFTYKTAIIGAYQKGKKSGGIEIVEDSTDHAIWKLKHKTFAAFNNKQDCQKHKIHLRKK